MIKLKYFPILLLLRHNKFVIKSLFGITLSCLLLLNNCYANESSTTTDLYKNKVCSLNKESNSNNQCLNNIIYYPYFIYVPTYHYPSRPYIWHNYYGYQHRNYYFNRRVYPYRHWQNPYRYRRQRMYRPHH